MPNTPILTYGDKQAEKYAKALQKVMRELDNRLTDIVSTATSASGLVEATQILNARPQMLQALQDSGYTELAQEFIDTYPGMVGTVDSSFTAAGLASPSFTTVDTLTFQQLAGADFAQFEFIGAAAMDELRFGLHRQAVANVPFSRLVESVKAATVGIDGKGSPLANHAYTHANSAILSFGGEVSIAAGKAIGAKEWEIVGPLDAKTRDVCVAALADPVRTEAEWQAADYWGGIPGGYNCRHHFRPAAITDEEIEALARE